jgi:uncharacterized protein
VTKQILPKSGDRRAVKLLLVILETILAIALSVVFFALGCGGGAWILGGIGAGALAFFFYRARINSQAQPNRIARKLGQALVGLTAGLAVQHRDLATLLPQLPLFLLLGLFLLGSGGIVGYLYARFQKTDWVTAVLATTPGNIGIMATIAVDYGKDPTLVSLVQLLRFTAVIGVVPLLIPGVPAENWQETLSTLTQELSYTHPQTLLLIPLILAVTAAVIPLGQALKIPVAAFFCAILVGVLFNGTINALLGGLSLDLIEDFKLPKALNILGQILLGITIGEYWSGTFNKLDKMTIARAFVPVLLTFLAGFGAAAIAHQLTDWDWLTCLLVTAPGGSPEMIWIATTLDRNVEIVASAHLFRIMLINLTLPGLIALDTLLAPYISAPPPLLELTEAPLAAESRSSIQKMQE